MAMAWVNGLGCARRMDPEDLKMELKESKAMSSSGGQHLYGWLFI